PVGKPLYGLPFAVKDNIDVAGLPTTAACPDFAHVAGASAPAVERLVAAGAILVGKTNLDQFATGLVGVRSPYPPPRNAFDPAIVPGGSSSGSAVAVARGLVAFALGTDTAGSGRVPAGLNNLVGLKPSLGLVPTRGVVPACRTLDCVSVFALTVEDAHAALAAMAGLDPADPFSRALPLGPLAAVPPRVRVGVPDPASRRFFGDDLAEAAFDIALGDAAGLGIEAVEVDLSPFFAAAELLYAGPWVAERYQAIRPLIEARPEALHPVTRAVIEGARAHSAADAFAGLHRLAELRRETEGLWRRVDALLVPTLPRPRTLADLAADPFAPNAELGTYTNFVNLLDLCALAVPGRFRADGFPSGVTLIAPAGRDAFLGALGSDLHARAGVPLGATGAPHPGPVARPTRAGPGEIEIAVVGAHLSGMPLNHELTSRGGRHLRSVGTTADYRLFALPGGPPRRPGLLRVADGAGRGIATEVWALSPAAFGAFVAGIPGPLGIGTLRLADGTAPKGFLVESVAVEGAEDVTAFGGWRAYVTSAAAA
ncbi:MAG TPA: allophanate hydrolase, partial [Salinarimonas sp.]|nr:allophanate hydrolase [Salinarimonas sp.]